MNAGQARTRLARAAVLDAARELFLARGYATTTMDAVSERSGVPAATVYRLFASKLGLLKALLDRALFGDNDPADITSFPHVPQLLADPDPCRQLTAFAGIARAMIGQATSIYQILVGAAASEPQAAGLLAEYTRTRDRGQGRLPQALAARGALRPGLPEREAADILHALASPEVYHLLVTVRGWSPDRYERWLAGTLISQLLPSREGQKRDEGE
ncbi:MAG TPA: helix-turn-helix domain-containing protein [Trebonia sp.]|nr:helix-turn-helix domain-containing protein [Trebonia sp.]